MTDQELIIAAVLNYVEGWYTADAERMTRALHPKIAKRRVTPEGETWDVTGDWMIEATKNGQGTIDDPERGRKDITVLDIAGSIASVKLVSEKFDDYLHLVKQENAWVIVNALWDFRQ
jgi:Putative lumazine-binding